MSWTNRCVESMLECKAAGLVFEEAWRLTLQQNPPMRRDLGPREPTLFEEDGPSVVEFLRDACADAWFGRRPKLAHLGKVLLERDTLLLDDHSTPAVHPSERGQVVTRRVA